MPAILFGSISTVADTSELQRSAFNEAFRTSGLDWTWDRDDYRTMLTGSGGQARIAEYAASKGQDVDAKAVHERKSQIFQDSLSTAGLAPRAGVTDTIKAAKSNGWKLGLVTTTSHQNVAALLEALGPEVQAADFDLIVNLSDVEESKPDSAAYVFALDNLDEKAADCVAIEDNVDGVQAAKGAGVACVAFPNENTAGHDFAAADGTVSVLDVAQLQHLAHS